MINYQNAMGYPITVNSTLYLVPDKVIYPPIFLSKRSGCQDALSKRSGSQDTLSTWSGSQDAGSVSCDVTDARPLWIR
jgi:hypothetical protein